MLQQQTLRVKKRISNQLRVAAFHLSRFFKRIHSGRIVPPPHSRGAQSVKTLNGRIHQARKVGVQLACFLK